MRSVALLFMLATSAWGVIVDRIAISAGTRIITESEIELRLRLTAFENGVKPVLSKEARKVAAAQLLDQKLVEREMDLGHYPRLSPEKREQLMLKAAGMAGALADDGLTVRDLEEDLARQEDLLTFLNLRFRPAGQVAGAELETWLQEQRKRTRIEYLDKDLAP